MERSTTRSASCCCAREPPSYRCTRGRAWPPCSAPSGHCTACSPRTREWTPAPSPRRGGSSWPTRAASPSGFSAPRFPWRADRLAMPTRHRRRRSTSACACAMSGPEERSPIFPRRARWTTRSAAPRPERMCCCSTARSGRTASCGQRARTRRRRGRWDISRWVGPPEASSCCPASARSGPCSCTSTTPIRSCAAPRPNGPKSRQLGSRWGKTAWSSTCEARVTLQRKLLLGFSLMVVPALLVGVQAVRTNALEQATLEELGQRLARSRTYAEVEDAMFNQTQVVWRYLGGDPRAKQEFPLTEQVVRYWLEGWTAGLSPDEMKLAPGLRAIEDQIRAGARRGLPLYQWGEREAGYGHAV